MAGDHPSHPEIPTELERKDSPQTDGVNLSPSRALAVDSELGWSKLAKRITGWTSNLLVTFLILAAGLVFGVQVLLWWKDTATEDQTTVNRDTRESLQVSRRWAEFYGGGGGFSCISFQGEEKAAIRRCEETCLEAVQRAVVRPGLPDAAERRVLAKLASILPIREEPNGSRVYRYPGDVPLWVGVKLGEKKSEGTDRAGAVDTDATDAGSLPPGSRIVAWAFLMPVTEREWTIYLLSPAAEGPQKGTLGSLGEEEFLFPVPPGATVVSRLSPGEGAFFGAFEESTPGASVTWPLFLDRELERQGWVPVGDWLGGAARKRRVFGRGTQTTEQSFLSIEITQDAHRPARGLVFGFRWTTEKRERSSEPQ
ncbi:MAG: hypothetical protein WBH86_04115 [Thermogutta sp.]|nr:hypothetical protein [Thermogutta sp.]HPU07374.1 hypothetical protein [Thermogutta sp.]